MQQVRIQGVLVGHKESFEALCRALAANEMHPVIDRVVAFDDVPAAFDRLAAGAHFGKVCVAM
jgi:NADPH:quinone reductase-like Zn-dependent oxidoreductase